MMFGQGGPVKVFVAMSPAEFGKGIDGLALAVQETFGLGPFCGAVFVFCSKRADRTKQLVWDQTGMVLVHKWLEGGTFVWPLLRDGVMRTSSAQLAALFEGLDWRLVRPERARRPLASGWARRYAGALALTGPEGPRNSPDRGSPSGSIRWRHDGLPSCPSSVSTFPFTAMT
jgi:transposase